MLNKITHIAVALMLLITTMGFTVSKQYCSDSLVKVTINAEAKSCCNIENECCRNETVHFHLEEDYVFPMVINDVQASNIDILFSIGFSLNQFEPGKDISSIVNYSESPPHPRIQTVLSLLQTYLF